ncbi:MAG: carboxypeptidase-like regulatory domain-containing protein [Rhodanobacter sp.]
MKNRSHHETGHAGRRTGWSVPGLSMAIALVVSGAAGTTAAHAQATVGKVFGWAPAGLTITAHSNTGVHRHTKANDSGRYTIGTLPMGVYEVALEKDGKAIDTRPNIKLTVGRGAEVDFACDHDQCAKSSSN